MLLLLWYNVSVNYYSLADMRFDKFNLIKRVDYLKMWSY